MRGERAEAAGGVTGMDARGSVALARWGWLIVVFVLLWPLPVQSGGDETYQTPLAGEEVHTEVAGRPVDVPPRDRRRVTAANVGVQFIPNGPSFYEVLPFGALYVWRSWDDDRRRFRGTFSGVVNDVNYNVALRGLTGWELLFTLDTFIIPFGRSEFVEGQRISEVEVEWNQAYAGIGLAYRKLISPYHQDTAVEVSLSYEPGFIWFKRGAEASREFKVPVDTYEGRVHLRVRADSLKRNLLELPHRGFAFGGDLLYGHRLKWEPWGGVVFDRPDAAREQTYLLGSAYAVVAGGLPYVRSERHRLVASLYGGIGKDLDRFSTFRLPGRPTGYEWEALPLPVMPAVAFNELFPRRYGIVDLVYRYEALFFLYPYVRGTYGLVERPRFVGNGAVKQQMDGLPAVGGGVVSGAPWRSQIELNYSYNFGIFRDPGGRPEKGGHGVFVFWSKELLW
ncbi:hypothetical protein [Candidatus Nitrospira bockiana]